MWGKEDHSIQSMAARATLPPLTSSDTLHWDGRGVSSQHVELGQNATSGACAVLPVLRQLARDAGSGHTCQRSFGASSPPLPVPAMDWARAAASSLTIYLPRRPLLPVHTVLPDVTGTLLWVHGQGDEEPITAAGHPVLLVQTPSSSRQEGDIEVVPHLPLNDPLHHHIVSLLQATVAAADMPGRLYAEALANALAGHFLQRYAACQQCKGVFSGGLTPFNLQRMTAYIQAHLEHALSLAELAALAHMRRAYFARLFKCATGKTLHQYVITCRMERAKQLLARVDVPLSEIALQVGCADQSHFTALFRRHVGTTPSSYRAAIVQDIGALPAQFKHDTTMLRTNVTDGTGPMPYLPYPCVMEPCSGRESRAS